MESIFCCFIFCISTPKSFLISILATNTVNKSLFIKFFAKVLAFQNKPDLPLDYHQEPVLLVPTESNATVVKR